MNIAEKTKSAILQEPTVFRITVNEPNLLHKTGILPKEKKIVLKPVLLGTLLRISKEVYGIDLTDQDEDLIKNREINPVAKTLVSALTSTDRMINVLALAITNSKKLPGRRLKRFLKDNLDSAQMFQILTMVANQLNVMDFMNSIILLKRISLINQEELIAPGEQSEGSRNISDSD